MTIQTSATRTENAAAELAHLGPGFMSRREHRVGRVVGEFVGQALSVPPGAALPQGVREEVQASIDHAIYKLEAHVSREGERSDRSSRQPGRRRSS